MSRVGILDIGSNSTVLSVFENGNVINTSTIVNRLRDGIHNQHISEEYIITLCNAVHTLISEAKDAYNISIVRGVATSAVRDAINGPYIVTLLNRMYGISVRIISGDEEARLTFNGITHNLPQQTQIITCDIGGASTEICKGVVGCDQFERYSIDIGCVRTLKSNNLYGTPSIDVILDAKQSILDALSPVIPMITDSKHQLIFSAGSAIAFESYTKESGGEISDIQNIMMDVIKTPLEVRKNNPSLYNREETAPVGFMIMSEVAHIMNTDSFVISHQGIAIGEYLNYLAA